MEKMDLCQVLRENGTGILKGDCRLVGVTNNEKEMMSGDLSFERLREEYGDFYIAKLRFSLNEKYLGEYDVWLTGFAFDSSVCISHDSLTGELMHLTEEECKKPGREEIDLVIREMYFECAEFYATLTPPPEISQKKKL